jgi:chromosome segregation ATPase
MYNGKSNYRLQFAGLLLLSGLICGFETAMAEPKTNDGSTAIKKAQGIIRQLTQEKAALEAEKAALITEKTTQDVKLSSLQESVKKLQPLATEVERYKSGLESVKSNLEAQLSQERQRQQALLQKHNDAVAKAKAIYADNQLLVQAVQEREQWIGQSSSRNKQLHTAYLDLLSKYKEKGVWQQLVELEPLTGIGKVETETVIEDYKYKLQQLKITPFEGSVPTEPIEGAPKSAALGSEDANR